MTGRVLSAEDREALAEVQRADWATEIAVVERIVARHRVVAADAARADLVARVERELDDADQTTDSLQRPNYIAVWGVRRALMPFGGKPHRWPVPAEFCAECGDLTADHGLVSIRSDEERCRSVDCDCLLSAREAAFGRDEAMDDEITNALWEDAVTNGEPWAVAPDHAETDRGRG